MSVEVAKRYGRAVDSEDWQTARALLDPNVVVVRPSGRRYEGADRWIELISEPDGDAKIDSTVEERTHEEHGGTVVETTRIVHRWRESGEIAYTSEETTEISFRGGRIARLASTVRHRAAA